MEKNCNPDEWWIMINVDVNVKNVIYVKKTMFAIMLHVIAKLENIQEVLWIIQQLCVIKLYSRTMKKQTISTNFNEKKGISKTHNFYILLVTL